MLTGLPSPARVLPLLALLGCATPAPDTLDPLPCYERYTAIDVDEVTDLGLAPRDAIGGYAAVFIDQDGRQRTVDVRLRRPRTGWIRDIVREPAFGYVETPACDVRVGVELEIQVETGDRWFAEGFDGVAVRSAFQDAWLIRALKPLGSLDGTWPEERPPSRCSDVDVGFSLTLDRGASGGRIVERLPGVPEADDACFREILTWEMPER